ncbi:hypothetical protein BKA61DRAFT_651106 [Leptodontidium sp. MPI-SDFR-AT-0119]|nr:hypothetical protein BKA61DRAFT_651106 [Leptodontidium sp. MPI-SDFR-AT-0119]
MRFFFLLLFHALFHAVFVASDLLVWVTEDLVGGRDVSVKYNNLNLLPILEDLAFFEIVVFTGSNDKPITIYTSPKYLFSDANFYKSSDDNVLSEYFAVRFSVPWGIGPNIARGYCLGIRSHLKQNEDIEVVNYSTRVSMINNGTLSPEIAEAANLQGQSGTTGPSRTFNCKGEPCSATSALAGLQLTPVETKKKVKEPLSNNQIFTIAISASVGALALILFVWIGLRCRKSLSGRKNAKRRWWNKVPPPTAGASELQGRIGPYTTAELGGDEHRGSVFELQAESIRKSQEGADAGKDILSLSIELSEVERRHVMGGNNNGGLKDDILSTPRAEMDANEAGNIDEIQPNPRTSTYSSKYLKKRDRKHNSAPTADSTVYTLRDTSPHESTAMLGSSSTDLPEDVVTRPTSLPPLQHNSDYESIPRQTKRLTDADLEALAGAFAPPAPRPKPKPKTGPWVYR